MADINQTITLGIGTPAGVPEFLTLGLQIGQVAVPDSVGLGYKSQVGILQWKAGVEKLEYKATEQ